MDKKIELCGNCVYYFVEDAFMMGEKKKIGFCCRFEPKKQKNEKSEPCDEYRRGQHST
jgi:hypothetical protein